MHNKQVNNNTKEKKYTVIYLSIQLDHFIHPERFMFEAVLYNNPASLLVLPLLMRLLAIGGKYGGRLPFTS